MAEDPLDATKIDQIAREVLTSLKKSRAEGAASFVPAPAPALHRSESTSAPHPSLRLLSVTGGVVGQPCVIEPDQVCVGSLKCRSFGH